jgi:hypothetical protein
LFNHSPGTIGRAVVDQHDLQLVPARRRHFGQLAVELFERSRFVEQGNNDADHAKSCQGGPPPRAGRRNAANVQDIRKRVRRHRRSGPRRRRFDIVRFKRPA